MTPNNTRMSMDHRCERRGSIARSLLALLLITHSVVQAQSTTFPEEPPPTQDELVRSLPGPVRIPGTRVSLVPPPSFRHLDGLSGFEKDDSTGIMVIDLAGGNFHTNTRNYSAENFRAKGLNVLKFEQVQVDGYPGIEALIQSPVDGSLSHQLTFGDTTFSAMVVCTMRERDTNTHRAVEKALATVTYDKEVLISPYEGTHFRLNDRSTDLKFVKKSGGAWLYARGGIEKRKYEGEPFLIALPLPFGRPHTCTSMAKEMIDKLEEKGFIKSHVTNASSAPVNGFDAFEAEFHGTLNGAGTVLYMLVVAQGDRCVVLEGNCTAPFAPALKAFRELAHTVSFR